MKKFFTIVFISLCVVCFSCSFIHAEELKIGVFDIQKIMKESKTFGNYHQDFLKAIEPKKKLLLDKEEFIKALEGKIKKDGNSLSPVDRKIIEEKLANEIKEARRMKEDFDTEVGKMNRDLQQKVFSDIYTIIKQIDEKENYTIIFDAYRAGIIHFRKTVDITDKILEKLK
jgi:outer membrane protein